MSEVQSLGVIGYLRALVCENLIWIALRIAPKEYTPSCVEAALLAREYEKTMRAHRQAATMVNSVIGQAVKR